MRELAAVDPISTEGLDPLQLAKGMGEAFSDYLVPMSVDTAKLASMFRQRGYRGDLSVAQVHRGAVVGFWFVGTNEAAYPGDLYVISMGVDPRHRRTGLARALFDRLIEGARERGFLRLRLEVIIGNDAAFNLYTTLGFAPVRSLLCYQGTLSQAAGFRDPCQFRTIPTHALDPSLLSEREWLPSWQNDVPVIANIEHHAHCIGAYIGDTFCGYGIADTADKTILQLFVKREHRRKGIATGIMHELGKTLGQRPVKALNIDANDQATSQFFESLGLQNYVSQYEMIHELEP